MIKYKLLGSSSCGDAEIVSSHEAVGKLGLSEQDGCSGS